MKFPTLRPSKARMGTFMEQHTKAALAAFGTIYQLTPSGKLTTIYQFDGPHGSFPLVQAADGNLYGTTAGFGFVNYGTIFKIVPSGDFALTLLFSFDAIDGAYPYAGLVQGSDRFGEIKAIVGGATSVVGSLTPTPKTDDNACIEGLARNLDNYSGFDGAVLNHETLRYEVFPFEMKLGDAVQVRADLDSGKLRAFVIHVAEGKPTDAASAREFKMLAKRDDGFLRHGVSIIHGVALGKADFVQMASADMGLIWSPRSNNQRSPA